MNMKITLKKACVHCGKEYSCKINKDDFKKFNEGEKVQKAFPYLTPGERELFFQTGICDECWNKMFTKEE